MFNFKALKGFALFYEIFLRVFAVPQAVGRRSISGEDRVQSQSSPCGFCLGESGDGTAFSPSTPVFFLFQYHSINAV